MIPHYSAAAATFATERFVFPDRMIKQQIFFNNLRALKS
jgi:hypothetical protein